MQQKLKRDILLETNIVGDFNEVALALGAKPAVCVCG